MSKLAKAIAIASQAFEHKTDKAGKPYILHCMRVMLAVGTDEERQIVAILHDVPEDTDISIDKLREMGFSTRVLIALELLTHKDDMPYMEYIKRLSHNADAKAVKKEDLKDNSQITRLKGLRQKDFDRLEKYCMAYTYLDN